MSAITQAHVAYCHGDKIVAENVRFISRLNMNPLNGAKRILFYKCYMESTDDALYWYRSLPELYVEVLWSETILADGYGRGCFLEQ